MFHTPAHLNVCSPAGQATPAHDVHSWPAFQSVVEMDRAWQDNLDAQEQSSIEMERAAGRRFAEWLAFPGDR